jgi:hypothetical protein
MIKKRENVYEQKRNYHSTGNGNNPVFTTKRSLYFADGYGEA